MFDGEGGGDAADRYIRESMFGGKFGAFRSRERHFFIDNQPVFRELGKIHKLRVGDGTEVKSGSWPVSITRDPTHEKIPSALNK